MWQRWVSVCVGVLSACGTSGGGPDAGSDGSIAEGGTDAAADALSDSANVDSETSSDGGAMLTGAQGFTVRFTWMNPALPPSECGGVDRTLDGGLAATAIDLFENDVSSVACRDAAASTAQGRYIGMGIASAQYAAGYTSGLTQALTTGTYVVGNQNVPDEDFCMIRYATQDASTAFFQVLAFNDAGIGFATWNGVSGTITVTSIASTYVSGTFAVQLADATGSNADGGSLTGAFTAPMCP